MPAWEAFLFGAIGSLLVEVNNILTYFHKGQQFPNRYFKPSFWFTRAVLVIGAGMIALAHDVQTKILAVHLGVATPLILQAFAKSPPTEVERSSQA